MKIDFLFETSWEVCNKVGGINTVIATKVPSVIDRVGENYLLIGPDIWKEPGTNHSFREDHEMYKDWKEHVLERGIKVRMGHWTIAGEPKVCLVDFTSHFAEKDAIFAELWEQYKLDSLHGEWDYVEPTIFGYVAGKVVESFHRFNLQNEINIVAQFHEWMTGSGILYLKKHDQEVATVFTTHATMLGRSLAGNGMALYSDLEQFDPQYYADKVNIISKYSMECLSAKYADCFTTVSGITARECTHLLKKTPDVITPNGFAEEFVPDEPAFSEMRAAARAKALEVASILTGKSYGEDTFLVINSGRYEFKNKGIDLFIKALRKLNEEDDGKKIIAYITIPAGHFGMSEVFQDRVDGQYNKALTHYLSDPDNDPILKALAEAGLHNLPEDRVDIIFAPVYLDGRDGVINLSYYDFLIGFDLSVFASYYEPWGYTPMESVAFAIPTITTGFAGFGDWVKEKIEIRNDAVLVLERNEADDSASIIQIHDHIREMAGREDLTPARNEAVEVYKRLLWPELTDQYQKAWEIAAKAAKRRTPRIKKWLKPDTLKLRSSSKEDRPIYRKILIDATIPERLETLVEISRNLWWCWHHDVTALFKSIDSKLWERCNNNPVELLKLISRNKLDKLSNNRGFLVRLNSIYTRFQNYMARPVDSDDNRVVYFSMEYGLHVSIRTYSGGLGVLAGDYLKQASDSGKNMVAVGLLYRHGYFKQQLSAHGDQLAKYTKQQFTKLPFQPVRDEDGEWITVSIDFPGRTVMAKAWLLQVGQVPLYLLDTDIVENSDADRLITYELYGGDNENRIKQELILGVGGIKLLERLDINAQIYHCNEGHAAFSCLERTRTLMEKSNVSYQTAKELVRANNLFTTHTPVPAGHDVFDENLIRTYLYSYFKTFQISWEDFMGLGRNHPVDHSEKFSMSVLATNLSQEVNGVSKLHGEVSREMFKAMYHHYYGPEIHIGHVTNGVHYYSWTAEDWQTLYRETFGDGFESDQYNEEHWDKILELDDKKVWEVKQKVKQKLIKYLKSKLAKDLPRRSESPETILNATKYLKDDTLLIGFARRFATYKRAHLLFDNLNQLAEIVNDEKRPVVFVFAGKAHPRDRAGQAFIKRIVEVSRMPRFVGKILFIENYNTKIGHYLTSGVDVWMNTPVRGKEASGTSGEKAVMNGVPNLSVLDGWWAEGYHPEAGWTINKKRTYKEQQHQDLLDAEMIRATIERKIKPTYYERDASGVSTKWVSYIKNTIAVVAPEFTMQRMLDDYYRKFYKPLIKRKNQFYGNNFQKAKEFVQWKNHVRHAWESIEVDAIVVPDPRKGPIDSGKHFFAEILLKMQGLTHHDIGIEIVFGRKDDDNNFRYLYKKEMQSDRRDGDSYHYQCDFPLKEGGVLDYAFRIHPKHKLMKYRMDFPLAKWV